MRLVHTLVLELVTRLLLGLAGVAAGGYVGVLLFSQFMAAGVECGTGAFSRLLLGGGLGGVLGFIAGLATGDLLAEFVYGLLEEDR